VDAVGVDVVYTRLEWGLRAEADLDSPLRIPVHTRGGGWSYDPADAADGKGASAARARARDLCGIRPADLDEDGLLDEIAACARTDSINHAHRITLIYELAQRRAGDAVSELTGRPVRGERAVSIGARAVADELALLLTLTRHEAERQTYTAVGMCTEGTQILDALTAGDIDLAKAETILDLTHTLITDTHTDDPDTDAHHLAENFQKKVLAKATHQNLTNLKKTANKALISIDPAAAQRRHDRKRERRTIRLSPLADSMCQLIADIPADLGTKAWAALTALAEAAQTPDDTRTLDQRRTDALIAAIIHALEALDATSIHHHCTHPDHHHTGTTSPNTENTDTDTDSNSNENSDENSDSDSNENGDRNSNENGDANRDEAGSDPVRDSDSSDEADSNPDPDPDPDPDSTSESTSPGSALAHRSDTLQPRRRPARPDAQILIVISAETLLGLNDNPAYLDGHGPIIAAMARDIAATGTWRCAITNTTHGTLNGLGTTTYSPAYPPTTKLRRHLSTRDQHCRFPGCTRPAKHCDIDHVTRYPDGPTCECNGECLCPHHHRIKHETGFRVRFSTDPNDPPATLIWTTPGGREYKDHPDPLNPDTNETPTSTPNTGKPNSDTMNSDTLSDGTPSDYLTTTESSPSAVKPKTILKTTPIGQGPPPF
jgi:hypothetical protein